MLDAYIIDQLMSSHFPVELVSAVFLVCKQNYAWLNFGSPAAQFTPPQLRILIFNSPFYPNPVNQSNYSA
jgi:hypothetical protein